MGGVLGGGPHQALRLSIVGGDHSGQISGTRVDGSAIMIEGIHVQW